MAVRAHVLFLCSFDLNRLTGTPIRARTTIEAAATKWNCHVVSLGEFPGFSHTNIYGVWGRRFGLGSETKFRLWRFWGPTFRELLRVRPRIVHCITTPGILPTLLYCQLIRGSRCVFEVHGVAQYEMRGANRLYRALFSHLERAGCLSADRVVVMSNTLKRFIVSAYHVPPDRISVMWGPVNLKEFPYMLPRTTGKLIVGYAGNNSFWQGLPTLFSALKLLQGRRDVELQLIGLSAGDVPVELVRQVKYIGHVPRTEIGRALAKCDLLVSTRTADQAANLQYPHKLSEYLAAGRPVVVTDTSDQREVVERARCGWVVPPDDPEALARAIEICADLSHMERCRLGANARQFAESTLTVDRLLSDLVGIYQAGGPGDGLLL